MTIENSETATWRNWINTLAAKRAEMAAAESALSDSLQTITRSKSRAYWVTTEANHLLGANINTQGPSKEERDLVRAMIRERLTPQVRSRLHIDDDQANVLSSHLHAIDEAEQALTDEQANHDVLMNTVHGLADKLAKLESEQPKATAEALAVLDDQIAIVEQEAARVTEIMAEYGANSGNDVAGEAIASAQARLDELAALEALGVSSAEDKKTAQAELTKAKAAGQKALDAASQRSAALRGLERKGQELADKIEEHRTIRNHVARLLHSEKLSELERQLVEYVQSSKLKNLMMDIRKTAATLESLSPNSSYRTGEMVIKMPRLNASRIHDALSSQNIYI